MPILLSDLLDQKANAIYESMKSDRMVPAYILAMTTELLALIAGDKEADGKTVKIAYAMLEAGADE